MSEAVIFPRWASPSREHPALIWRGADWSRGWLQDSIRRIGQDLAEEGIGARSTVVLEADFSPVSVACLFALMERGAVVVPLAQATPADGLTRAEVTAADFWCSVDAGEAVTVRRLSSTCPTPPLIQQLQKRNHPGLVLFTSGSTGRGKAVLHDLAQLLEKFQTPRPAARTIAFLLFDHIGGLNTLFHGLFHGGPLILTDQRDPDAVGALIERHRAEVLPTSPTFLNLVLLAEAWRRHDWRSLRRITYGTEPMPEATLRRLRQALPQVELTQTYGLSELGILRAKSYSSDSLLVKVGGVGVETKIVAGVLWIRTSSAMLGYLNAPSPFDEDGWFNTGDLVEPQGDFLRIHGRKGELINVGGEKVHPAEVEGVIAALDNITDVVVQAESHPLTGQILVARVAVRVPEDPVHLRTRVRQACRERLAAFKVPARVTLAAALPPTVRFKKSRGQPESA